MNLNSRFFPAKRFSRSSRCFEADGSITWTFHEGMHEDMYTHVCVPVYCVCMYIDMHTHIYTFYIFQQYD